MGRVDGYAPIRDYALIGDGRTGALVACDGSIDWLCLPDVDSQSVFARLLDADRGGSFQLSPVEPFESERRYLSGTNVLETTFRTSSGSVRVTDAMTTSGATLGPLRELVRSIEGVSGEVTMRYLLEPRMAYGRDTRLHPRGRGRVVASTRADAIAFETWGAGQPGCADTCATADFTLRTGDRALLQLSSAHEEPLVFSCRSEIEDRLRHTIAFWERWGKRARYDGPWRDAVLRSALLLKLLVYAPSGAIVAAPTTSLPERIGGGRNWDYRYTWLRDASWTVDALVQLGYDDEAAAFVWWFMHASRLTQPRLQVLYRVNGDAHVAESTLALDGYRGSRPVRTGNGAANQTQLDLYGGVVHSIWLFVDSGGQIDRATGKDVARVADWVATNWRRPDAGIWEVRSEPRHFVQSKVLCWVALDRACRLAARGSIPDRSVEWRREADDIRRFVDEHGWDDGRGSYVRAPTLRDLDASLLTLPLLEWAPSDDERQRRTVRAIRHDLGHGPYVFRYRGGDGVEGDEGAFLTCSFWLVDALARIGELEEATALMDELVAQANDVGLYSEEIDPRDGSFLGNFPQGLTHLALVNAAVTIARVEQEQA